MALYTMRTGATAHPEDSVLQHLTDQISSSGVFEFAGNDFKVQAQGTPDLTVKVIKGRAYIKAVSGNSYPIRADADSNVSIGSNSSGNPRIDALVLFIDLSAAPNSDASNVAKLQVVQGTPAPSPIAPTDAAIQTEIGASNPFIRLANITVASGATSIANANIADTRAEVVYIVGGVRNQKGFLDIKEQASSPATPPSGRMLIYPKGDNKVYKKDDLGIETEIGSGGGGSTSFVNNETPSGFVDGVNKVFTTVGSYVGGATLVFRDGQLMAPGGADYTETTPASGIITFTTAPVTGSVILISYQSAVSTTGNSDTVDGIHAASTPTANKLLALDVSAQFPASIHETNTFIPNTAKFAAYHAGAGQVVPTSATTVIKLNTTNFDPGSNFNTSTFRFTAPKAGFYIFTAAMAYTSYPDGKRQDMGISVNGSERVYRYGIPNGAAQDTGLNISGIFQLAASDFVELTTGQFSGVNQTTLSGVAIVYMHGHLISA